MREHTLLKLHASATGMTCLPPARPGHLLRSGGSGLGRDGAAYPSYRLVCCLDLNPNGSVGLVSLSCDSWLVGWFDRLAINQRSYLFSCFLVEGSRLSSPLTGRVEILNHSKETNWSQPSSSTDYPVNKVSHLKVCRTDLYTSSEVNPCSPC